MRLAIGPELTGNPVTHLDLQGVALFSLPMTLFVLTSITQLNAPQNFLITLPTEVAQLTNLRTLGVRSNTVLSRTYDEETGGQWVKRVAWGWSREEGRVRNADRMYPLPLFLVQLSPPHIVRVACAVLNLTLATSVEDLDVGENQIQGIDVCSSARSSAPLRL